MVEAIIAALLVGIIAMITVPRLNFAAIPKQKAHCTARKIVTDLRRTRRLAISDAANNTEGFRLRMLGGPGYTAYEIVNLNTSVMVDSHTIDSDVSCTGGTTFDFGPLGNLKTGSGTELIVGAEGKHITITIITATGAVQCVDN